MKIAHGTLEGRANHRRNGTPVCDECQAAYRESRAKWRKEQAEARKILNGLNLERMRGMPRWGTKAEPPTAVLSTDTDLEIARRRKVLEDYRQDAAEERLA